MSNLTKFPFSGRRVSDPKHPVLDVLETYWRTLRLGSAAPARSRIDPCAIDTALPWTFMLQANPNGTARIRVAGQKLHDMTDMDPRGMMIGAFFHPEDQDALAGALLSVIEDPALVALPLTAPGSLLRAPIDATILFLPLSDSDGEITRVLGALVCDKAAPLKGRKFAIEHKLPIRNEPLSATTQLQTTKNGPDTSRRPALRLVVNNR